MAPANTTNPADIEAAFSRLENTAMDRLRHEGVGDEDIIIHRTVEMMYQGQWRSLSVQAPSTVKNIDTLVEGFHSEHLREYNFRRDDAPVSIFRVAITATGVVPKAKLKKYALETSSSATSTKREVWFNSQSHVAAVYNRTDLSAGTKLNGPVIVEQFDSTVFVPPGAHAEIDEYLNILIHIQEAGNV